MNFDDFIKHLQSASSTAQQNLDQVGKHVQETIKQAQEAVEPTINAVAEQTGYVAQHTYSTVQQHAASASQFIHDQATAIGEQAEHVLSLDEMGRKIASLGTPAIFFAVACSIAGGMGLAGGAVITTALAMLGGPFGMVGGLITLGVLTAIADTVSQFGIEAVLIATFTARQEQGATLGEIHQEIDTLWLSDELKLKLKQRFTAP